MKLKMLLLTMCCSLMGSAVADNRHFYPQTPINSVKESVLPGYCEIEIINSSYDDVIVYGTFDEGSVMTPFNVYRYENPHYISNFFNGYCHPVMYLDIVTFRGYHIYSGYTQSNSTVRIVPYLVNQSKAEIQAK
jgi:hypothetical protein